MPDAKKNMKCPACGKENLDGSQFCDGCGERFRRVENKISEPNFLAASPDISKVEPVSRTSIGIPLFSEEKEEENAAPRAATNGQQADSEIHATLLIERGNSVGKVFELTSDESLLGRWDADNGIFPDVDLDTHDPEAKISRRHARIIRDGRRYLIEDLGSTNGTFINRGRRLIPGIRQPLGDGDEIIVGKTFLRFHKV